MILRSISANDIEEVKRIHAQFYEKEFEFPNFKKSLCVFVVEEDGRIICSVDLHTILEVTLITDKSVSQFKRKTALLQVIAACKYVSHQYGYDQIHAFVQEPIWKRALRKFGFRPTKGNALVINVE